MATYNLGRFILNPRGNYNSSTTYNKLDVVLYNGSSYICKSNNIAGISPIMTNTWQLLAIAGQATMTEQQKQEIIDTLLAEGVIIDAEYNTFTTAEKQKLAGLSNPKNGVLSIYYNGNNLGQFRANQDTNTTIYLPTPEDGGVSLVRADNDELIGKFHMNQHEDQIIRIPVGSGGGGGTATITIQQGGNNVGSFALTDTTNSTINIPNNTLTIQQNGTTVATYTPRGNATANITVPVSSSDLADAAHIKLSETIITPDTQDGDNEILAGDGHILKLNPNTIYVTKTLGDFRIEDLNFEDNENAYMMENFKSYVMLDVDRDFDLRLPRGCFICGSPMLERGYRYILTIQGQFFKIDKYEEIQ